MAANFTSIGEALKGFHSSHLHPGGCRGVLAGHPTETQAEQSR
jgi:hypothetical protein